MNVDDFQRNYQRSYMGVRPATVLKSIAFDMSDDIKWIPATVPRIQSQGIRLTCIVPINGHLNTLHTVLPWVEDIDEQEYIYSSAPRLGMIQTQHSCVYINRAPHRQYHRGYVPSACNAWRASDVETYEDTTPDSANVIWGIYNNTFNPIHKALDILQKGERVACALGKQLALKLSSELVHPILWYRREDVGYVDVALNKCFLYPEASELCEDYVAKICQLPVGRLE